MITSQLADTPGSASRISRAAPTGVHRANADEGWRLDAAQLIEKLAIADDLHPGLAQFGMLFWPRLLILARDVWAEGGRNLGLLGVGGRLAAEARAGESAAWTPSHASETLDQSSARSEEPNPDSTTRPPASAGLLGAVEQHDRCAHGVPEDDRSVDADGIGELTQVIGAGLEDLRTGSPVSDRPWPRRSR